MAESEARAAREELEALLGADGSNVTQVRGIHRRILVLLGELERAEEHSVLLTRYLSQAWR